jgi:colicin import membrane protein
VDRRDDQLGPLLLSLAIHALFMAGLWVATLRCETWNEAVARLALPGFLSMECVEPLNLEGPVIEAMLVDYSPPKTTPASVPRPRPQPPKPEPPKPEVETPPPPPLPPAPPRAEDTIDRERVARDGQLPALDEQREQEERRKREQVELEAQERLAEMERERQQQLADIRRLREQAEQRRKLEEQRLAQIEDRQRQDRERSEERQRVEGLEVRENAQRAGTGGTDNDLRARYVFALQQVVTMNWLRPDTARAGLRCTVRIVQLPGGEVMSASVVPPCNGDPLTQRSLEAAVMRAQPLPYQGYESVFQRSIDFVFRYDG